MSRRALASLIAVAAVLLIATGALAGVLLARGDDEGDAGGSASQAVAATGKGYIGLTVALIAPGAGLRVTNVEPNGPAAAAGIEPGDVVRAVDDEVVRTPEKLRSVVEAHGPGEQVTLTYERADRQRQAVLKLGEAPEDFDIEAGPGAPFGNLLLNRTRLGVRIEQITPAVKLRLNLQRDQGVVVVDVTPGSAAANAGLQPGDIFLRAGAATIDTIDELQRAILSAPPGQPLELRLLRGSQELTLRANLGPELSVDALGGILPQQLRERLQQQLDQGQITPEQLQQVLRLYRARGENVRVGTVKEVSATSLKLGLLSGEEVTVGLTPQTGATRAGARIRPAELQAGELVLVLSMDGGETASVIMAYGVFDLQNLR